MYKHKLFCHRTLIWLVCTRTLCSTFSLTYFTDDNTVYNFPHIRKQLGISSAKQLIFGNGKATKYTQNNNTKAAQCSLTIQLVLIALNTANGQNHFELYFYSNTYKEMQINTKQSAECNKYHT